jgi:hypothetical protein
VQTLAPKLADALREHSVTLLMLKRWGEALPILREAAELYRPLAHIAPGFQLDYILTLTNLAMLLSFLGCESEMVEVAAVASSMCRACLASPATHSPFQVHLGMNPEEFESRLGQAVNSLCRLLLPVRRRRDEISLSIGLDLGNALRHLRAICFVVGWLDLALEAAAEAVEVYRQLAAARPEEFEPALADSLRLLGLMSSAARRRSRYADG